MSKKNEEKKIGLKRVEKRMSLLERLLFWILIVFFVISFICNYLSNYFDTQSYYGIAISMTIASAAILALDYFYFCRVWKRNLTKWHVLCFWLIMALSALFIVQYYGLIHFTLLEAKGYWMFPPVACLLWITQLVFGDVTWIDYEARKKAEMKAQQKK